MSGLGSLMEGFQGGQEHMDKRRRGKAIDNILDREADEYDRARTSAGERMGAVGGEMEEFSNPAEKDPLLVRGFNYFKNKFGFGSKPSDNTSTAGLTQPIEAGIDEQAMEPEQFDYSTLQGRADGGVVRKKAIPMANGGKVPSLRDDLTEEERLQRSYGATGYTTEAEAAANRETREGRHPRNRNPNSPYNRDSKRVVAGPSAIPTSGGGAGEFAEDLKRTAGETHTARAIANTRPVREFNRQNVKDAVGDEATGAAFRDRVQDAGAASLNVAGGVMSDVVESTGLGTLGRRIKGFVGKNGTRSNPQTDPTTNPAVQAIDTAIGPEETDGQMADKAVESAISMTPGHPDNPNQDFDFAEVSASGVTPEDIPSALVSDWAKYRKTMAIADAREGKSIEEGQMEITKMQMDGFSSNLQQSAFLMVQNDMRGAALAARMAWQYFPNGSDVRFGVTEGANGQQALVGMGTDEETGEPVGKGEPMLLNPQSINAMVAQVNDPKAWNVWVKDQQDTLQTDREYNEITKPTAQAELENTAAHTEYLKSGTAANQMEAARGGGKPLTRSERSTAERAFRESQQLASLDDERLAQTLASRMADLYSQLGGDIPENTIIDLVMGVHDEEFTLKEGLAKYGIETGR